MRDHRSSGHRAFARREFSRSPSAGRFCKSDDAQEFLATLPIETLAIEVNWLGHCLWSARGLVYTVFVERKPARRSVDFDRERFDRQRREKFLAVIDLQTAGPDGCGKSRRANARCPLER